MYSILIVTKDESRFTTLVSKLEEESFYVELIEINEKDVLKHKKLEDCDLVITDLIYSNGFQEEAILKICDHTRFPVVTFIDQLTHDEIIDIYKYATTSVIQFSHPLNVVIAKLKSILKVVHHIKRSGNEHRVIGPIEIDLKNRYIKNKNDILPLTNVEYKILSILLNMKDQTVSKDYLIHRVWDKDSSATDNALGIHIMRLRKKLIISPNRSLIETVWGVGYKLNTKCVEDHSQDLIPALD